MWKDGDEDAKMKFFEKIIALEMSGKKQEWKKWGQQHAFLEECDSVTTKQYSTFLLNS